MVELKIIKDFYNIGRETIHIITGISANALLKYERDNLEPPKKYKLLIQSLMNLETFNRLFHLAKGQLMYYDIEKIENKIKEEVSWREREVSLLRYDIMTIKCEHKFLNYDTDEFSVTQCRICGERDGEFITS